MEVTLAMQPTMDGSQDNAQVADLSEKAPSSRGPGHGPLKRSRWQVEPRKPRPSGREGSLAGWIWGRYWPVISAPMPHGSRIREKSILASFCGAWGHLKVSAVRREDIDRWAAELRARCGPATYNRYRTRLLHMWTQAQVWGYVTENPAKHLKKLREPRGRVKYLTDAQRVKIWEAPSPVREYAILSWETGARLSMCHGLQRWMVDMDRGLVAYPADLPGTKNGDIHEAPITTKDEPTAPPGRLAGLFAGLGIAKMPSGDYVLPRVHPCSVSRAFRKYVERTLGLRDFHFHDLLHDRCTQLAAQGVNQKVIQRYRGHRDSRMTDRYTHVDIGTLWNALDGGQGW